MAHGFDGKVVAVTGAGKGLGKAYALYLGKLGASVVVNNRLPPDDSVSSADRVAGQIREAGGSAVAEYSSVENLESGEKLLETALQAFGQLDAVVANAGIFERRSFHKQDLAELHKVIAINLMGTLNVLHPVFRYMYQRRSGSLLVSTSGAGLYGEHGLPSYSASKAALLGLMHSLNLEGSRHGVRINALAPYATTGMTDSDLPEALKDRLEPGRVAPVMAWLISAGCPLSGEILVTGAGRISRAKMLETATLKLQSESGYDPDQIHETWRQLEAQPLEVEYRGALKQFGAFAGN